MPCQAERAACVTVRSTTTFSTSGWCATYIRSSVIKDSCSKRINNHKDTKNTKIQIKNLCAFVVFLKGENYAARFSGHAGLHPTVGAYGSLLESIKSNRQGE